MEGELLNNTAQVEDKKDKGLFGKLKSMVVNVWTDISSHWNKPAKGSYVSYKEITAYSVGGFGQQLVIIFLSYLGLSASNTLLGSAIGLQPIHLQIMLMVQQVLGLFFSIIRSKVVDNTRSKYGRFRPYILTMGFPVVALSVIFVFLPFEHMSYNLKLMYSFLFSTLCANGIGFLATFYLDTYNELRTVISPSSHERGKVIAISSIVFSMAPTIYYAIMPPLSELFGGFTNINTYRYGVAPFAIIGVIFGVFGALGTKERIIVAESYTPKINLIWGLKNIYRNKPFVIRTIASLFVFLRAANIIVLNWIFIYEIQNMGLMGILNTVTGTASGIAMFLSPFILKKIGTKNTYLIKEFLPIIFSILVFITIPVFPLFYIFMYLQTFVLAFGLIVDPVIHGEVKDYQQYISGKRLDFTFGTAGAILLPITLASGYLIPFLQQALGITKNYDVLYDPQVRNGIIQMLCGLTIVGAVLSFIPVLFYDLTTSRYDNVVKVLKVRAMFENYAENTLSAEDIKAGVELINEAKELNELIPLSKDEIKEKYRNDSQIDKKRARKNYFANTRQSEEINSSRILIEELNKFSTEAFILDAEIANKIVSLGLNDVKKGEIEEFISLATTLPEGTKEERKYKKKRIKQAKALEKMYITLEKQYDGAAIEPDPKLIREANSLPASTFEEAKVRRLEIRKLQKIFGVFHKVADPYIQAKNLLKTKKSYEAYEEIYQKYESACLEVEENTQLEAEKEKELAEQKKAELEKNKAMKAEKRAKKKNKG